MIPIFVVLYRNPDVERRCLAAVRSFADPTKFDLVVVDNGDANENLAVVWNRMVRQYERSPHWHNDSDPVFCLLNTDCFLVDAETLPRLEQVLRASPKVGFAGPMTDHCNSAQSINTPNWQRVGGWTKEAFADQVLFGQYISGFCLLVRLAAWRDAGGFDASAPFYGQESALIWKARQHGWQTAMVVDAFVEHLGGATAKKYLDQDAERQKGRQWFREYQQKTGVAAQQAPSSSDAAGRPPLNAEGR